MTKLTESTFLSSDGKTKLHAMQWLPEGGVTAVLQIAHGVSEHIARYDRFARFLNDHGVAVAGHDHLGHGRSVTAGGVPVYFGDGNTWQTVVDDVYALHIRLKEQFPGAPMALLGHSMGSFAARSYLIRYAGTVDAAIVMGTGWQSGVKLRGGLAVAQTLARRDPAAVSAFVNDLAFGGYNKPFAPARTPFDWLSADTDNVDAYMADPLCGQSATVGLFREMLRGIRFNQRPDNLARMDADTPVLLVSGAQDPVGDMGEGVRRTYEAFRHAGVRDCTLKLYDGLRHEILNEQAAQEQVYGELLRWIEEKTR